MLKKDIQDNIVIAQLSDGASNAIDIETLRELKKIIDEVNEKDELKGLILTGEGRFFSSGFSLPMFVGFKSNEEVVSFFEEEEGILLDYFTCKKPVVCAMNGHSAAMGLILAMASDYRIIANHPKIKVGMSEIKIGLGLSIAQSAIVKFGLDSDRLYRDVMYFGRMGGVEKALELKMVDEVVEQDNLINRAKEIISLWIDTPNRPFIQIKAGLKKETADRISHDLKTVKWQELMASTLMNQEVKDTLAFVQAAMEQK
ncbi:MAG: enoyl-CoA hydratase/isomerase family protein [Desulfobacterales bacterium]|nr:enoyl-CoA hydratase/isomerase family protein [Desulfobacterales bacterium]MCP4164027.1 enoyl-CoA hydratase/isomerase family protein [Deltaproteobacteria bacterium]